MTKAYAQSGATVTLSATTTSSNTTLFGNSNTVEVVNIGTVATHVAFGSAEALAATTADRVIGPNATVVMHKGGATRVACRTASGTATLYVTPVE
jgi:ATP-dependent protease ClpP protease subunit